ncbi:MAG TPA: hypothetical protein VMU14_01975, partial [Acidimicrobiales bacterium]|nr:hypothetical protein [Acidimicrobiales bacterium]
MAPDGPGNGHEPPALPRGGASNGDDPAGLRPPGMLDVTTTVEDEPELIVQPWAPEVRKPRPLWDRVKILVLLAVLWWLLLWYSMSNNPLLGFGDAVHQEWLAKWWLEALFGIELVRQMHYLVSEHSA